jgi:hypothetical protein
VRTLLAAVAGAAILFGVVLAGSAIWPEASTMSLFVRIALTFIGAVTSGYVCGRAAAAGGRLAAIALLIAIVLGASVAWARIHGQEDLPQGLLPAVTLLSVIGIWAGAMIERAMRGSARRPGVQGSKGPRVRS